MKELVLSWLHINRINIAAQMIPIAHHGSFENSTNMCFSLSFQ